MRLYCDAMVVNKGRLSRKRQRACPLGHQNCYLAHVDCKEVARIERQLRLGSGVFSWCAVRHGRKSETFALALIGTSVFRSLLFLPNDAIRNGQSTCRDIPQRRTQRSRTTNARFRIRAALWKTIPPPERARSIHLDIFVAPSRSLVIG